MLRNDADSWGAPAKLFHWVMAALILAQIALGVMAASWRVSPTKLELFFWHKSTGMLILALVALRLLWRLANPPPELPSGIAAWERPAARLSPVLLYALMIALPATRWIINSPSKVPIRNFCLLPLPAIAAPDEPTADRGAGRVQGVRGTPALRPGQAGRGQPRCHRQGHERRHEHRRREQGNPRQGLVRLRRLSTGRVPFDRPAPHRRQSLRGARHAALERREAAGRGAVQLDGFRRRRRHRRRR